MTETPSQNTTLHVNARIIDAFHAGELKQSGAWAGATHKQRRHPVHVLRYQPRGHRYDTSSVPDYVKLSTLTHCRVQEIPEQECDLRGAGAAAMYESAQGHQHTPPSPVHHGM